MNTGRLLKKHTLDETEHGPILRHIDERLTGIRWCRKKTLINLLAGFLRKLLEDAISAVLVIILKTMRFMIKYNIQGYAANIAGFRASYLFRIGEDDIVSIRFRRGRMKIKRKAVADPDIEIVVSDVLSFMQYILGGSNVDYIDALLYNEVKYYGNTNLIFKFGYMAAHLLHIFKLAGKMQEAVDKPRL